MNARHRLTAIPAERAAYASELKERRALEADYQQRLDALVTATGMRTKEQNWELESLGECLTLIRGGLQGPGTLNGAEATVRGLEGVTGIPLGHEVLARRVGPLSIVALQHALSALDDEERRLRAELAAWPDESSRRRYRFRGPGKHYQAGRRLQVGDEIELTRSEAEAFADRFVPVEAQPA